MVKTLLPTQPGAHKISVADYLDELFKLDSKVAKASTYLLPLETPNELLNFLTIEHKSDTYIWNNSDGKLVGYFSIINLQDKDSLEVLSIIVDPDCQHQGYGSQMMLYAEDIAKKLGKTKMWLVTNVKNLPAVHFYKSIGFEIVKEAENYYGDGETRYILEKKIKS